MGGVFEEGAFLRFLFTLRFSFGAAPSYSIDLKACDRLLFKAPETYIGVSTGAGLLQQEGSYGAVERVHATHS